MQTSKQAVGKKSFFPIIIVTIGSGMKHQWVLKPNRKFK